MKFEANKQGIDVNKLQTATAAEGSRSAGLPCLAVVEPVALSRSRHATARARSLSQLLEHLVPDPEVVVSRQRLQGTLRLNARPQAPPVSCELRAARVARHHVTASVEDLPVAIWSGQQHDIPLGRSSELLHRVVR